MSTTSRTAGWIATEYHNQSSPGTFLSPGPEENAPVPNPTLLSLSVSPSSIASGGTVTITATLSGVAPSGGASVSLLSSNPTALPVPTAITVIAGQASGSTTATAGSVASATNVTVTGTYNSSSQSGTITVTPTIETITVITNPPNLTVTVDNVNYTAPQSFPWGAGTSHSIAAPSPQNGITGGQYLFSGWSDGGAVAHSITVPSTPATYTASFSVVNFPLTITGISPAAAPVGGQVTITGTNFGSTAGTVTFHGTAATPASWSATSITVNVPSGASSGPVLVSAGGLDSNEWNFTVVPSVISVSPTSGSAGTQVTILGSGFGAAPGTVWLGSTPGSVVSWNSSQIVATVAANAVSGRCGGATERVLVELGSIYGGDSDHFQLEFDQRTAGGASDDQRVGLRRGPG